MTKRTKKIAGILFAVLTLAAIFMVISPPSVSADAGTLIEQGLSDAAGSNYSDVSLSTFVGRVIQALLSATGMIFIGITVYAGIMYMTAAGDDNKVKKAKDMLTTSIIGIVIVVGAYAFTSFVVDRLSEATTTTQPQAEGG